MYKYYVNLSLLSLVSDQVGHLYCLFPMKPVATIVHRQIAMELADIIVVIRLSAPKKPKNLQGIFDFETPPIEFESVFVKGRLL